VAFGLRNVSSKCQLKEADTTFVPTGLIDIGQSGFAVRLICTSDHPQVQAYATLSYCWGHSSMYKLTASTFDELKSGIQQSALPKTYTDTFTAMRHLGIQYIWIDALCIFQDSLPDWHQESSVMHRIYGDAVFSIAATGVSTVD
jgi:hypothetical protein